MTRKAVLDQIRVATHGECWNWQCVKNDGYVHSRAPNGNNKLFAEDEEILFMMVHFISETSVQTRQEGSKERFFL